MLNITCIFVSCHIEFSQNFIFYPSSRLCKKVLSCRYFLIITSHFNYLITRKVLYITTKIQVLSILGKCGYLSHFCTVFQLCNDDLPPFCFDCLCFYLIFFWFIASILHKCSDVLSIVIFALMTYFLFYYVFIFSHLYVCPQFHVFLHIITHVNCYIYL